RLADRMGSARDLLAELEAITRPHTRTGMVASEEGNPYAGLSAFQERDAARFFGRETAVEQIVARLGESTLLALVGSSGMGKSSLVRAGVIPALKHSGDPWESFVLRPGPHPLAALAELLAQLRSTATSESPAIELDRGELRARLRREPGFLG